MSSNSSLQTPFGALTEAVQRRNTIADWMFYDVGGLSASEFTLLSQQTNREGAILVVEPSDGGDSNRIQKFETFQTFRAPGITSIRAFHFIWIFSVFSPVNKPSTADRQCGAEAP